MAAHSTGGHSTGAAGAAGQMLTPGRAITRVVVGVGEFRVAAHPAKPSDSAVTILSGFGFGSCVGVVVYDMAAHVAGLAHILLPVSRRDESGKILGNPRKYADTSLAAMLGELESLGALRARLAAKLAGGANMFPDLRENWRPRPAPEFTGELPATPVGSRNVIAVRAILKDLGITIAAEDTGGSHGRSLEFDIGAGTLTVTTAHSGSRTI